MKKKKIKGYAVVCSNLKEFNNSIFAFVQINAALAKREHLNREFSGHCNHKIILCEITLIYKKKI